MTGALSIRKKLLLIIMLATTLTGMSGYGVFLVWYFQNQQEQLVGYSRTVAQVLGQDFARLVLLNDVSVAADVSAKLDSFKLVRQMVLYDEDSGQALYHYRTEDMASVPIPILPLASERTLQTWQGQLRLFLPAEYAGTDFGILYFRIQHEGLAEILERDLVALVAIGALSLILAFLLAVGFERGFNKPILRLVAFLRQINQAEAADRRIAEIEHNELGQVYQAVNSMLDRIDASNEQLKLAAVAFETQDGITITDSQAKILKVNQAFTRITGYLPEEVVGRTPAVLKSGRQGPQFYQELWKTLQRDGRWSGEIWNRNKSGAIYPEWLSIQSVTDGTGTVTHYVGIFTDLTELKDAEQQLDYLGKYDALTGLANRELLSVRLAESIDAQRDHQCLGALICVDLDNFKLINDTLGYGAGDLILVEVSRRLRTLFGNETLLARLGGDVFVVVHDDLCQAVNEATLHIESLLERLILALERPYAIDGTSYSFTVSIGISLFPAAGTDPVTYIKQAETALHEVKKTPKAKWRFFEPEVERIARQYLERQRELQDALQEDQFRLFYQSQHNHLGQVLSAEALIRWQHPHEGLLAPNHIIPVAEQSGLIVPIGQWVLRTACLQLAAWQSHPVYRHWSLSVNVSPLQFSEDECVSRIQAILQETQAPPALLKLELTESMLLEGVQVAIDRMHSLRELGIQLSLDDFGTGYSSLQYLKALPFTQVKIDQGFVRNMTHSPSDLAIVKSIISLGDAFGMEVIAEGVETQEQCQQLEALGCRLFQGYFFSRPQTVETLMQDHLPA